MLKRFSKYVLQSVAGMIGLSVYILADTFFIAYASGADGLAALNLILPVFGLIYAIGAMIGIGSATRYGISKAKGEATDHYFTQSIAWSVLFSIPFVLAGIFAPDKCLALLGADARLVELGKTYLRIILIVAPLFMSNYTVTAFARNDNATSKVMAGSLAGSVFNVVFDYIFIFPMGLGFSGAALATAFCPVVTMLICSTHYMSKKCSVGFRWKKLSVRHLISCCQLGVSAFVGEISSAVITFIFNMLILGLTGSTGVAAYGVVANMSLVGMAITNGMAQGTQPLISESFGKGEHGQVKKLLRWALTSVIVVEAAMVVLVWIFTDPFVAIYSKESRMTEVLSAEFLWKDGKPSVSEFMAYLKKPVTIGQITECLEDEMKIIPAFEDDYLIAFEDVCLSKDPFRETINQKRQIKKEKKIYPNEPCPCGSGKKYKKCCGK